MKKKKVYESPTMDVIEVQVNQSILAGSSLSTGMDITLEEEEWSSRMLEEELGFSF